MPKWKEKKILCIWPSDKEEWARISKFLHSSSFGSRFGTVGLRHNQQWIHFNLSVYAYRSWNCLELHHLWFKLSIYVYWCWSLETVLLCRITSFGVYTTYRWYLGVVSFCKTEREGADVLKERKVQFWNGSYR